MLRSNAAPVVAVICLLLSPPTLGEAADQFKVDPDHTSVLFLVSHLGYSRVIGRFREFAGEFVLDQQNPANSRVVITINTASLDTNQPKRDAHLRSPDFFNVKEFPEMTFSSTLVQTTDGRNGKLTGDLTLLGVTRPVTLDVEINKVAPHPDPRTGMLVAGFSARAKLKRSDFGMTYGLRGGLGDEIEIWLEVEGEAPLPADQ